MTERENNIESNVAGGLALPRALATDYASRPSFRLALTIQGVSLILDIISMLFGQQPLSSVLEGERQFPVVTTVPKQYLATPYDLTSVRMKTPEGAFIPLSSVIRAVTEPGMAQVNRVNGQRRAVVSMNFDGDDLVGSSRLNRLQRRCSLLG